MERNKLLNKQTEILKTNENNIIWHIWVCSETWLIMADQPSANHCSRVYVRVAQFNWLTYAIRALG